MTAKLDKEDGEGEDGEEEKPKNLDSLRFSEIRRFLDKTAKEPLRGILNSRIFKLRSVKSYDEKLLENPSFCSLDLSALQIKLDLLA